MKLDDILDLWNEDARIDRYNLIDESLKIPLLQSKYYQIYMNEKRLLVREQENYKNYEMAKSFYYMGKLDKEELKTRGWEQFNLQIPKTDIPKIVESDQEVIDKKIKISEQSEKVKFVEAILQSIHQRSFNLKNAIEVMKFEAGG